MKLEIVIIIIVIKLVQSYVLAHVLSTMRIYYSIVIYSIRYFVSSKRYALHALHTFPASAGLIKFLCPPHPQHSFRWFPRGIRLWFASDQSRHGRSLRQGFSSLLHHGLALVVAVAPGRSRLVEHPDVAPRQRGLWVETRIVHVDSPRLAIQHTLH